MHLQGAKSIYDTIPEAFKSSSSFEFLKPWFQYHYVFSQYTYPPQVTGSDIKPPDNMVKNGKVWHKLVKITPILQETSFLTANRSSEFWAAQPRCST
jgi:hypothetical protein